MHISEGYNALVSGLRFLYCEKGERGPVLQSIWGIFSFQRKPTTNRKKKVADSGRKSKILNIDGK